MSQRTRRKLLKLRSNLLLLLVVCGALLAAPAIVMALIANPSANTLPAQTIQSEEANDALGKTVTLTGSNWQSGESVRISVNDDQGKTWSRNVDVTADASGQIQVQFQLPDWLVGTYTVTAMGEQSGVATTSFTDGNVSFRRTSPPVPRSQRPWVSPIESL